MENIVRKITRGQYQQFIDDYYHGRHKGQRLGQAFCNTFNIVDPSAFNDVNEEHALDHIESTYVESDVEWPVYQEAMGG